MDNAGKCVTNAVPYDIIGADNMADIRHLLDAIQHVGQARYGLGRFLEDLRMDVRQYGYVTTRVGQRYMLLPQAGVMMESTFRLLKHVNHGDQSNLRQASELWVAAARASIETGEGLPELGEPLIALPGYHI